MATAQLIQELRNGLSLLPEGAAVYLYLSSGQALTFPARGGNWRIDDRILIADSRLFIDLSSVVGFTIVPRDRPAMGEGGSDDDADRRV